MGNNGGVVIRADFEAKEKYAFAWLKRNFWPLHIGFLSSLDPSMWDFNIVNFDVRV
jgi:hypothetical protein